MTAPRPVTRQELRTAIRAVRTDVLTAMFTELADVLGRVRAIEDWLGRPIAEPDAGWRALADARSAALVKWFDDPEQDDIHDEPGEPAEQKE